MTWSLWAFSEWSPLSPWPLPLPVEGQSWWKSHVCLIDSARFREAFTVDLAKEKSSLFPPVPEPAKPRAERAAVSSLLRLPPHYLQSSLGSRVQAGPSWVCEWPVLGSLQAPLSSQRRQPGLPSDTPKLVFFFLLLLSFFP